MKKLVCCGTSLDMESLLEQQRRYHEERERLMEAMVGESVGNGIGIGNGNANGKTKLLSHRESLNSEHRTKAMIHRYQECTQRLKEIYEDKDGGRKDEVLKLSGPNEFQEFNARLKQIKEFHRRHPNEVSVPMSVEFDELKKLREGKK